MSERDNHSIYEFAPPLLTDFERGRAEGQREGREAMLRSLVVDDDCDCLTCQWAVRALAFPVASETRCDGRYPVGHPRDEPFEVTYRCGLTQGHAGPHGAVASETVKE
jgi:hypothetical protein